MVLAPIYDGNSRSDAACLGNVTLENIRDWVIRFNERSPRGLVNGKVPGEQSRLYDQQRAVWALAVERDPKPYLDGFVRLCDLAQWLWEDFRVSVSEQTLSREVRAMGYRKLVASPNKPEYVSASDKKSFRFSSNVARPTWASQVCRCSSQWALAWELLQMSEETLLASRTNPLGLQKT